MLASRIATQHLIAPYRNVTDDRSFLFGMALKRGATLYFAGEGKYGIATRINSAEKALTDEERQALDPRLNGQLPIITLMGSKMRLKAAEQIDQMILVIAEWRAYYEGLGYPIRFIVFDTLAASFEINDENNNSEMQKIVTALSEYAERFNCFILIVAHPPKSKNHVHGYTRGASALINSADVVLELKKVNNSGHRILTVTKMRDGQSEDAIFPLKITIFDGAPALVANTHHAIQVKEAKTLTKDQILVLNIITHAPIGTADRDYIYNKLWLLKAEHINEKSKKLLKTTSLQKQVRRVLNALLKMAKIAEDGDMTGRVFYIAPTIAPSLESSAQWKSRINDIARKFS